MDREHLKGIPEKAKASMKYAAGKMMGAKPAAISTFMRMLSVVKKTVNFDDPGNYHLYYGDRVGHPGPF